MAAVPSIGRAAGVAPGPADADATQELYERYSSRVYGFCANRLGSHDEAEDATQSTFLNAHRALRRGVTPEAELAWLFKIAHNVCLTRRRSSRRRNRVESPSDLGAVQDILPAPPRESADELIRLTDALSHMPDSQRRAILLREWQGLSYHEIAADLDLTQSAVETLIFRARRALAANLEVEPKQPLLLARVRKAFDVATLLAGFKTLFATSAAVKATAATVAVSSAVVVATDAPRPTSKPATPEPSAVVAKAPAVPAAPVIVSADLRRAAPAAVHRAPAPLVRQKAKPAAAADAKAPPANEASRLVVPPGQTRKAAVVDKAKGPTRPVRARPAVSQPKQAVVQKAVKAKPAQKPAPPAQAKSNAEAPAPQGPPAHAATGAGNGRGQGQGQGDG